MVGVRVSENNGGGGGVFNKTIPLTLVGYEIVIANSAVRAPLAIYHPISDACSWNNSEVSIPR